MRKKSLFRLLSFLMLIIAVIFVICALSCPTLGHTIYIGGFSFGAKEWRIGYLIYLLIMISFFIGSFFMKNAK